MNKKASILRILLHGFFLVSTNLVSVLLVFTIAQLADMNTEKIVKASIALIINIAIYFAVYRAMYSVQKEIMKIDDFSMFAIIFMISMALLPAVFYPLHYLTHGIWSSFDNLLALWPYQFVVNGLCLVMNFFILRKHK